MDNTTNETSRSLAVLALPRRIDAFIAYAVDVVRAMTVNPAFPSPAPALATVLAAVEDLRVAEAQVMARHPGATVGRDARRSVLVTLLHGAAVPIPRGDQDRRDPLVGARARERAMKTATVIPIRRARQLCRQCGCRPAITRIRGKHRVAKDHDLCRQCWRSWMDSVRHRAS